MANEFIIEQVTEVVNELLTTEPSDFLVSVKLKPTNNIKVYIDSDEGMSIEKCVRYNRKLHSLIEEKMFPEGDFSLEVSSPGVDEPLKNSRQYRKNIGRQVLVTYLDGSENEGKLIEATENDLILEQTIGKGKKAVVQQLVVPIQNIKSTVVQVQF